MRKEGRPGQMSILSVVLRSEREMLTRMTLSQRSVRGEVKGEKRNDLGSRSEMMGVESVTARTSRLLIRYCQLNY